MGFLGLSFTSNLKREKYRVECLKKDMELLKSSMQSKMQEEMERLEKNNKSKDQMILEYGENLKELKDQVKQLKDQKEQLTARLSYENKQSEILNEELGIWTKRAEASASVFKYLYENIQKEDRPRVKNALKDLFDINMEYEPDDNTELDKSVVEDTDKKEESFVEVGEAEVIFEDQVKEPKKPKKKSSSKKKTPKKQ